MASKLLISTGLVLVLAVSGELAMSQQPAPADGAPQAVPTDPWAATVDPRVQERTYLFTDTGEQMPYALFVSSKVKKNEKAPLIISLHGLGGTQNTMVSTRLKTIDLAEDGGYIFAAPMGYNCGGWYGMPTRARPPAPPPGAAPQGAAPAANGPPRGPFRAMACKGGGTKVTDPAEVRDLSEKDVMNVLAMVRREFNVDDRRIYLMGHSMGASGTLYLGAKHADIWAAIAADAPPGAPNAEGIAATKMPTLIIQGDADPAVPVAGTRGYVEKLKMLDADYKYIEVPGQDHNITGIPDMYAWFAQHTKAVH